MKGAFTGFEPGTVKASDPIRIPRSSEVNHYTYKCVNPRCGAEDTMKLFPGENVPVAISCSQCHGGVGCGIQGAEAEMQRRGVGMRLKATLQPTSPVGSVRPS